jgi:hypothetical protein
MSRIRDWRSTLGSIARTILDIDQFWWTWFAAAVGTVVVLRLLGGRNFEPEAGIAAVPFFLAGIGSVSILYAVAVEMRPRRNGRPPPPIECGPSSTSTTRSRGESMIPGAVGLALAVLSIFLHLAIARSELTILVVGLPLVLVFSPAFALFAFGYLRGEATLGAYGYRTMPFAFGAFAGLAGIVLLVRSLGVTSAAKGLFFPLLVGGIVLVLYVLSVVRALRPPHDSVD